MVPETAIQPDADAIRRDLQFMTARWGELSTPAVFEIRAFKEGAQTQTAKFARDWIDGREGAVEWIVNMNRLGFNIYAVRNPVDHRTNGSAKDGDIICSFFLWADCDDEASAGNVRRFDGPKYTAAVTTGRVPSARVHVYWALEEPCYDLDEWRAMQVRVAAHFNSDRSVINPSRIMRVGGTVSHPAKKKRERGYVSELTTFRSDYDDPRQPVTLEQMGRVFKAAAPVSGPEAGAKTFEIDVAPAALDREKTRLQALSGQEWHDAVIRLVGSYVSRGLEDHEIHALTDQLTLTGYTVEETRAEVQTAIDGARRKGWAPEPQRNPFEPEPDRSRIGAGSELVSSWPTPLDDFDETTLPRRQWVYGYDYIRKFVSVVASAGGVGKTSNAIVEALAIVTNRPLLKVAVKEQTKVWVINLEDPRDEIVMRTLAAMKFYSIRPEDVRGRLFLDGEDTIRITLAVEDRNGVQLNDELIDMMRERITRDGIGVVIIDPFVSTHLVNENSNASIQAVVALLRSLARETGCALSLVHHTRKGNGMDADVDSVRGAGSLIGAARAARVINRISERAAIEMGIPMLDAKGIFRIDDGKANLAPPAEQAVYRKMIGVELGNGEWVGVATPYELPDEWAGMSEDVVNKMLTQIDLGTDPDNPGGELYSLRPQDKTRWAGLVVTGYPFTNADHFKTEAQAKLILRKWLETGLLEEVEYRSAVQRKDRKGVLSTGRVGDISGAENDVR